MSDNCAENTVIFVLIYFLVFQLFFRFSFANYFLVLVSF